MAFKGKKFNIHGSFKTKADAKKKEAQLKDEGKISFILERNNRFIVLEPKHRSHKDKPKKHHKGSKDQFSKHKSFLDMKIL